MYYHGHGVSQDPAEAMHWFRLAADQGNAVAQTNLGVMYYHGHGVSQNLGEAVHWFRLAADQGNAVAQTNLGVMYQAGQGVSQDLGEAVQWYRLAAEQGYGTAQFYLALMYEHGFGISQNSFEAERWFKLAAAQGNAEAKERLASLAPFAQPQPKGPDEGLSDGAKVAIGVAAAAVILAIIGMSSDAEPSDGTAPYGGNDFGEEYQDPCKQSGIATDSCLEFID
jgi:TPR repeat protein